MKLRKPQLDDKTKIEILKVALLATAGGFLSTLWGASWVISQMEAKERKLFMTAELNHKVVERFIELVDPEISARIVDEFKFDSIVGELDL